MATISEIMHYKVLKDLFSTLFHSERAAMLSIYSNLSYDKAYAMHAEKQGKIFFQVLYTVKNIDEVRRKIDNYLKERKN